MRKWRIFIFSIMALTMLLFSSLRSHAQLLNGDFSAGGANWTVTAPGTTDSVSFAANNLVATSNDIGPAFGPNLQTFASQTFTADDPGFLSYVLTYTDTDVGDFDFPIAIIDGTTFRIALDGSLVAAPPAVNNANNVAGLTGFTTLTAGLRTVAFGVQTLDSGFGPGVATWDDIDFQEVAQSPGGQTVLENNSLTITGADALEVATNGPTAANSMEVTLSVSDGIITLGAPGSITITGGANGTDTITFTGTPAQVNIAMASIIYTPDTGFSGSDTLVFTATSGGISDTDNIPITVTPGTSSLTVTKTALPAVNVPVGATITYTYVVTNTGDQVLTNISLSDSHNGSGPAPSPTNEALTLDGGAPGGSSDSGNNGIWDTLAPGDAVTFTGTYIVTQNDVDTLQ